jgi:RelA/SpoT family (p)ppGpp synthetase
MRTPATSRRAVRSARSGDDRILHTPTVFNPLRNLLARFAETPTLDSFTRLLELCARYIPTADLDLIRAAYVLGYEAHAGAFRQSGEPFIEHPIAVAAILAGLAVDAQGIAAALLHDTAEDTDVSLETLRETFGATISEIVEGVTKFGVVEAPKQGVARPSSEAPRPDLPPDMRTTQERKAQANAETVHKLFLTMMRDPRVVLLKLADRLHNMRTLGAMSARQREVKSLEALEIYAPLAGRIGLYGVKGELEDLAFSYLFPSDFMRVVGILRAEEAKRAKWAQRMCDRMRRELAASGVSAAVNWRLKRPYRAWKEAQEVGTDILLLNDLIAFRVLVSTVADCYQALGYIHRLWLPYERIRDYIANGKANGYQSLHTAVFALDGRLAQVHIRTHPMHRAALHGVVSAWMERAATGVHEAAGQVRGEQPLWVQQLASWENDLKLSALDFVDAIRDEMFEAQVFVFTPRGEVRELPAGATALDLAYQIHTRVGDHAVGARIQTTSPGGALLGREVPINYVLQTGDVVEIMTDPHVYPQPDWRDLAVTRYAREKITRALRLRARQELSGSSPRKEEASDAAVDGRLDQAGAIPPGPLTHPGGELAQIRLATCCYPCPGDEILGLAERGAVVSVHRACCLRLRAILKRRHARGEPYAEALRVNWSEIAPEFYRLRLAIWGQDHRGLMYEVSSSVASLGLNVVHAVATANQDRYKAAISLTLEMPLDVRRDTVLRKLRAVPGVTHVERDTRKGCDGTHV